MCQKLFPRSDALRSSVMKQEQPTMWEVLIKTIVTHTSTYFIFGLLASTVFGYAALFAHTSLNLFMRQLNDPFVVAGALFQPLRGALFGVVFYLLEDRIFQKKDGWLVLWIVMVALGIIGAFGPTPGSLEGMIYTVVPLSIQLRVLPEVMLQALALAVVLVYWVNHPDKKWLNWMLGIAFFFALLFPTLGLLIQQPQ